MGVNFQHGAWRAKARIKDRSVLVGSFPTEGEARAALALEYDAIRAGTSVHLTSPDALSLKTYAARIGVRHGTVKRWAIEGMPVLRAGGSVRVDPEPADRWVQEHHSASVAFARESRVYLVQRDSDGAIKIGFTSDVMRRVKEVRKESSAEVSLLAVFPGDKPDELRIHGRFREARLDGEWFRPVPELLDFIDSLRRVAA